MNFWRRWTGWITVEPVEFLYCLMFTTSNVVRSNLFIDKVCRNDFNYTDEVCTNLTTNGYVENSTYKDEVQKRVAQLENWDALLVALPSVIFCLFIGNWSDFHGRKPLIILPLAGSVLQYVAYILNLFFYSLPTEMLLWGSIFGLFGGYPCFNIGLYGYVSDVTNRQDRTTRLSVLNGVFSLGFVIGTTLGQQLYTHVGNYYLIFSLSIVFALLGVAWTIFLVDESVRANPEDVKQARFFDCTNFTESLRTALKSRPEKKTRFKIILLILNFSLFAFTQSTSKYDYLLLNKKFDWTINLYSWYINVQRICRLLGLFVLLPLLSSFGLHDNLIGAIGTLLTMIAYTMIAVGEAGWLVFVSAVLQFNSVITVTIRAQCTKSVELEEYGRIFSAVGFFQALVPLIANPLFSLVYRFTVEIYPGTYLLVLVGLLSIAFMSSGYLYLSDLKERRRSPDRIEEILRNQQENSQEGHENTADNIPIGIDNPKIEVRGNEILED